ncbi:Ff.00g013910.m01.CDS01 [Fusarium sp. VM40]|nr:Ff.00g013910.m01.CDS01 [Fusarium sp. VM40]
MGDLAETETMDDIAVNQLNGGVGDGAAMVFMFNDKLISVSIFPSNGSSTKDTCHLGLEERPLQDHLVDLISKATTCQDDDEYERLEDEVLGVILDAGRHLFSGPIFSRRARTESSKTLHNLLFPPILYFRLEAPASCVSIVPIKPSESNSILTIDPALDQGFEEKLEIYQDLPCYIPDEIVVMEVFLRGANCITAAVQVHGQDMFCKSRVEPGGLFGTGEGRELECLGELRKVFNQSDAIRIPQLLGYVHHKDTKQILGFLRQWVPGRRLSNIDITSATEGKRQKWTSQIRETIESLHKHGLVWGDGKSSNIIIDEQDDAWLIDFGGGSTQGWADEELAETKEGDEQALTKIAQLLNEDNRASLSS